MMQVFFLFLSIPLVVVVVVVSSYYLSFFLPSICKHISPPGFLDVEAKGARPLLRAVVGHAAVDITAAFDE